MTLYTRRLLVNRFNLVMSLLAMAFGLAFLLWILVTLAHAGLGAVSAKLFTQMTPPPGSSGGLLNAIMGSVIMAGLADRHAGRHSRRHLPGRVRQPRLARAVDAIHQRHPAVGAVDRHRPVRLRGLCVSRRSLFGLGRSVRTGLDRDTGSRAHDREHAAAGARQPA
jgi:hypothetical protein